MINNKILLSPILLVQFLLFGFGLISGLEKFYSFFLLFVSVLFPMTLLIRKFVDCAKVEFQYGIDIISKLFYLSILLMCISIFSSDAKDLIHSKNMIIFDDIFFATSASILISITLVVSLLTLPKTNSILFLFTSAAFVISYQKISFEISYPLDYTTFMCMIYRGPASMLDLLWIWLFYKNADEIMEPEQTCIIGNIYIRIFSISIASFILFSNIVFSLDSADFEIYSNYYALLLKSLLSIFIFLILAKKIYKSDMNNQMIFFYPILLFLFSIMYDLSIYNKSVSITYYDRGFLHALILSAIMLTYNKFNSSKPFTIMQQWQIRSYTFGYMSNIFINLIHSNFHVTNEYFSLVMMNVKIISFLLIASGMLLFVIISFNNMLQNKKIRL